MSVVVAGSVLGTLLAVPPAEACGGRAATIADDPARLASATEPGPGGMTLHTDQQGNVYVTAADVKVSSALAEAIARRYVRQRYHTTGPVEFEAFTYDHGDLVYMFHAHVRGLAASMHVGPLRFVTTHAHVHVSATTGDVYGFGCGLGSGIVEMKFEPAAYPADLRSRRLPYVQFDTPFVAREGRAPTIDGRIEAAEWGDAGHEVIHVGTGRKAVTEYG
jgi:hypothetical protein